MIGTNDGKNFKKNFVSCDIPFKEFSRKKLYLTNLLHTEMFHCLLDDKENRMCKSTLYSHDSVQQIIIKLLLVLFLFSFSIFY